MSDDYFIMGVDPGISGALAFYNPKFPQLIAAYDMPVVGNKELNAAELFDIIDSVKQRIAEITPSLPSGVELQAVYDRSTLIRAAIENGDASQMERIVGLVNACGAMQATKEAAAEQAEIALQALAVLPDNAYKQALQALASQLTHRQH